MSSLYPKNNVTDVLQASVTMTHKTLHQELMFPVITTKLNAVLKDYKSHMLTSVFCIFFLHKAVDERERERERLSTTKVCFLFNCYCATVTGESKADNKRIIEVLVKWNFTPEPPNFLLFFFVFSEGQTIWVNDGLHEKLHLYQCVVFTFIL